MRVNDREREILLCLVKRELVVRGYAVAGRYDLPSKDAGLQLDLESLRRRLENGEEE